MSFDDSGTPREAEAGGDGVEIPAEEAGESAHRLWSVPLGLAYPLLEQVSALMTHQTGEHSVEVA